MLENIKIYASDKYWNHILADLGANLVETPDVADVIFDDISINAPISVDDLQNLILSQFNNNDIIADIFGHDEVLPELQRKILVALYKKPNIQMGELKLAVGLAPDITTHSVENAIYQLRKTFGHDFILNENGGYKIGRI
jgi:hypothetical protein